MSQQTGFFGQLLYRRVPQYLGLYIAGVWMAIEIGDWLTDQFALPNGLTAFTFVFLAAMLPSVAVFAWTHGAPGKDASNRFERAFIPANLLIAVALVFIMPARQGGPDGAAVADATTATEEASVATGARISSQRIFVFFPRNDTTEAPDWIAYSASVLLSRDLDRSSPRVGAVTPFNNSSTLERMRRAGFERAIGEPLTVQLDMTEAPDWIAYSASVLLSRDLDRSSPRVGAVTPFNNSSTLERMRRAGFERAIGEPLTVQLDMT
ncbi:MAG: hypothetical protein AAAFM81_02055, partial [Pseudomonadota bacterium]